MENLRYPIHIRALCIIITAILLMFSLLPLIWMVSTSFKTTKEQLAIDLNLNIRTIFKSLRWLNENLLVQEVKCVDHSDFMVNPYFVMNNFDREARIAEWNRRSILDSQRKIRLRKEKRRREQKKASQQ